MKLRAGRRINILLLILLLVNIHVGLCQEDNSSQEKSKDKVRKLSKNKEKLNKFKQIKSANVTSLLDSDDEDTNSTIKTTTATTPRYSKIPNSPTRRLTSTTAAPKPEPELTNNEERLMEYLLSIRRNKNSRPKKNWTEPVTVKIGMALIHLGKFLTDHLALPDHIDGRYFRS